MTALPFRALPRFFAGHKFPPPARCYFPFGSRFAASSSAVTFDSTPPAGTSAFADHRIALSTSLR